MLNHAEETHVRIAVLEEYESDFNDDGKPDLVSSAFTFIKIRVFLQESLA